MRRTLAAIVLAAACGRTPADEAASIQPATIHEAAAVPAEAEAVASPDEPVQAPELPTATHGAVILVPLQSFPEGLLDVVQAKLEAELAVEVRRLDVQPLPKSAYYAKRRRYRADKLLDHLLQFTDGEPESTRVLGLTEVDISTTKDQFVDWGIFGLGAMPGQAAVVSIFRLKRRASTEQLEFRLATVALHEIGHTLGLDHCTEPLCAMQDAEGSIANTDTSTGRFGPQCQAELDAARLQ